MAKETPLSDSMEDYLETIFHLSREKGFARAKSIARQMQVHMPSVTGALRTLKARGLVEYEPYAVVTLTSRGEREARQLVRSHAALKTFLWRILGLPEKEADENACRMEHAISPRTLDRLIAFVDFLDRSPEASCRRVADFAAKHRGKRKRTLRKPKRETG